MKNVSFIFNLKKKNQRKFLANSTTTETSYFNLSMPQFPHGIMRINSG